MERKVFGDSFGNSQALEILHLSVNLEIQELFCSIRHFQSLLLAHKHSNAASTKVQDGGVTIAESVYSAFFSRHVCVCRSENVTPPIDNSKPKLNDLTPSCTYVIGRVK